MTRRIVPATLFASALCGVAVIVLVPRVGDVLLIPLALGVSGQLAIAFAFPRLAHPERWILGGDCLSVATISWGVALTGGFRSPFVPLLVLPLVAVAGRHTVPVFVAFTALCLAAPSLAALVAINRHMGFAAARAPADLAVIGGVAAMTIGLTRAEWHYRHQSLLDPLTGLLNRLALERRFEELRAQGSHGDGALCLIAGDIDGFKAINDTFGHEVGDIVLRDVAGVLRTSLRTFSLIYRVGGEEFLAILPGVGRNEGRRVAERLRAAVAGARPQELDVTMSFGVAASVRAELDYERLYAAADSCLYRAKRAGRNCVVVETPQAAADDERRQPSALTRSTSSASTRSASALGT